MLRSHVSWNHNLSTLMLEDLNLLQTATTNIVLQLLLPSLFILSLQVLPASCPSRSLSKEHCWGCKTFFNKAELAWGFWGSYLLSNLLKASNPKWVPLEVFLTISNASPSVREIKAWRAWAETSSAPSGKSSSSDLSVIATSTVDSNFWMTWIAFLWHDSTHVLNL